ncbi:MAG: PfkB family carbohydrate kinase, partial [Nocardioidaceae bacterium]
VIASSDMLVMQLELPLEVVEEAAGWAHGQGTRVMLTPAPVLPVPDSLLANVDLLVCNEHEVVQLADEPDIVAAARALLGRGPSSVVVTCGAQGCLHVGRGTAPVEVAAPRVQAVDTTAAGDTFAGCLAVALCEGRGVGDSLRWATAAAAMSVQRAGASGSMPHRWELDNFHASLDDGCEG